MIVSKYVIESGRLKPVVNPADLAVGEGAGAGECWYDVEDPSPDDLRQFLSPLGLHPVMLGRCLDRANTPGVISYGPAVLMEYPAAVNLDEQEPPYLTFILQPPVLVTVRHNRIPEVSKLLQEMTSASSTSVGHLVQCLHTVLDELTDATVKAQTETRDRILEMAKMIASNPRMVHDQDLSELRWRVDRLVSLIENQLYCVTALVASDNENLQDPHRKAYLQDLVSEAEIAQRGIYSLEGRVSALYFAYQSLGSSRVEKRLRILTIISAMTLPFGLIAGLLGMNVGGLPWLDNPNGFWIVIAILLAIALGELWYFKKSGWFD
jgi:Mg2+ and Co2+ transporter CorA